MRSIYLLIHNSINREIIWEGKKKKKEEEQSSAGYHKCLPAFSKFASSSSFFLNFKKILKEEKLRSSLVGSWLSQSRVEITIFELRSTWEIELEDHIFFDLKNIRGVCSPNGTLLPFISFDWSFSIHLKWSQCFKEEPSRIRIQREGWSLSLIDLVKGQPGLILTFLLWESSWNLIRNLILKQI